MRKVAVWILAIMFAFYGVILLTSEGTDTSGEPENLAEISYEDIENNQIYYIDELIVADTHSVLEDSNVNYYLVMFYDGDEKLVAANLPVNESCEIWDDLEDYMEDDSMYIGDMVISCYVKAETDNTDTREFFQSRVWELELEGGMDIEPMELRFDYVCDEDGDPYETAEGANTVTKVMGVLTILAAVLIAYFGAIRKSKAKASAKKVPPVPTYTAPAVPTYSAPETPQWKRQAEEVGRRYAQEHIQRPAAPTYTAPETPQQASLRFSGRRSSEPVAPAAPAAEDPVMTELNRYKALHDAGFMTDEEYEQTRRKILGL